MAMPTSRLAFITKRRRGQLPAIKNNNSNDNNRQGLMSGKEGSVRVRGASIRDGTGHDAVLVDFPRDGDDALFIQASAD